MKYYITQQGRDFINEVSVEKTLDVAQGVMNRSKYKADKERIKAGIPRGGHHDSSQKHRVTPGLSKAKSHIETKKSQVVRLAQKHRARQEHGLARDPKGNIKPKDSSQWR